MKLFPDALFELAQETVRDLVHSRRRITTAESCTGGLIAALLTEVPGSSDVIGRGFVTYSNEAKEKVLGVSAETLRKFGAVSVETVREMAEGALVVADHDADIAVAVSGVAGPGGGAEAKPVGTVHVAVAVRGARTSEEKFLLPGDRTEVRLATVREALRMVRERASEI